MQFFYCVTSKVGRLITALEFDKIQFFSKHMAMISIVMMETWQNFGGTTLIYIASITGIPKDLYEAAEIDGASVFQRIRYITVPIMKRLLLLMLILQLISTSQSFQAQLSMTDGGPDNGTLTYMLLMTREAFTNLDFGRATALGTLMFVTLLLLSIVVTKLQRKGDEE